MRIAQTLVAMVASVGLAGCGSSSAPTSASSFVPSVPVTPVSGSFGVFSQTKLAATPESAFARCLQGVGDAACFAGGIASNNATASVTNPISANARRSGTTSAASALPGAPTDLTADLYRIGLSTTVELYWNPPPGSGAEVTNYVVQVGSASGRSDVTSVMTNGTPCSPVCNFSAPFSSVGVFYLRVVAVTAAGDGPPSNEIILSFDDPNVPGEPYGPFVGVVGSPVTLTWTAPVSGAAPTTYILQASSTLAGAPNLANFSTGNAATTFTASGVAPGVYYVRVLAANAAGVGPPSSGAVLSVGTPGCTAPPSPPTNLNACGVVVGETGLVSDHWSTGYVLRG